MQKPYVVVSLPEAKTGLSNDEIASIHSALERQRDHLAQCASQAIAIGQAADQASKLLNELQAQYLPEGWYDCDLHLDIKAVFNDYVQSDAPLEVSEVLDELGALFWCMRLNTSSQEMISKLISGLNDLKELARYGICHVVSGHCVIAATEPDADSEIGERELWQAIHRLAALPTAVHQLLGIELPNNKRPAFLSQVTNNATLH